MTTAFREVGRGNPGPPIVFLHGLGGTQGSWGPQLRDLGTDRHCLAWDMPGYGESSPEDPLTFASIADRLAGFIDELGLGPVDLVGLSFGGMHALHAANRHPDRIRRLVLADTSPEFGMDGTDPDEWKQARLSVLDDGGVPGDIAAVVLDAIVGRPLDPAIRNELIDAFAAIEADGFRAAVECLPNNDIRPALPSITHPALVVVGELDEETPVAYAEVLANEMANAQLRVMAGVGHLSPSEDPATFNGLVREFLS